MWHVCLPTHLRCFTRSGLLRPSTILLLTLVWLFCSWSAWAAPPLSDYQQRVSRAAQLALETAQQAPLTDEQIRQLHTLKQLLPAQEEIEIEAVPPGQAIRVDNLWLHELLDSLTADPVQREFQLAELAARLTALQQRLGLASANSAGVGQVDEAARARLVRILSQREYQRGQAEPSAIKQWLDKVLRELRVLIRRLFGSSPQMPHQPSRYTVNLTRIVILIVLGLGLFFALYKLFRWAGVRRKPAASENDAREILGETITEHTTTEDLLASARALAQQGEHRAAIRRAYIALLYELEQQGKLRLHQAKTNRDYLNALRHEQTLYPSFFALTRIFERIWYGHAQATEFDFEGFLNGYESVVSRQ